jgi:hypothetical protein
MCLVLERRRAHTVVMGFTHRIATMDDLVVLEAVMDAAIGELQQGFLSAEEIESSRAIMGIDSQLIKDLLRGARGRSGRRVRRLEPPSDLVRR